MTAQAEPPPAGKVALASRGPWADAARQLVRSPLAVAALVILGALVIVAIFADQVAPSSPREQLYFKEGAAVCQEYAPTADHLMGVDSSCRDTFSRVVHATRISLTVGVFTQVIALAIGIAIGGTAGLAGGWLDNALMRFTDAMYGFPDLLLIILFAAVFRETWLGDFAGGVFAIFLAVGITGWVTIARLVRGQFLSLREREFVLAARAVGASDWTILRRHLLPNALGPLIVAVTFGIPAAIFAEASLSFIGIGIRPPTASWGVMISEGYSLIVVSYWPVAFPAAAIALVMLSFTFLGDALQDALDPRSPR